MSSPEKLRDETFLRALKRMLYNILMPYTREKLQGEEKISKCSFIQKKLSPSDDSPSQFLSFALSTISTDCNVAGGRIAIVVQWLFKWTFIGRIMIQYRHINVDIIKKRENVEKLMLYNTTHNLCSMGFIIWKLSISQSRFSIFDSSRDFYFRAKKRERETVLLCTKNNKKEKRDS